MPLPALPLKAIFRLILLIVIFSSCHDSQKSALKITSKKSTPQPDAESKDVHYPEKVLEVYLDSIGHLPTQPLADAAAYLADSVFKNFTVPLNRELSADDFNLLKQAARAGMIRPRIARKVFGELPVDSNCTAKSLLDSVKKGFIFLKVFSF